MQNGTMNEHGCISSSGAWSHLPPAWREGLRAGTADWLVLAMTSPTSLPDFNPDLLRAWTVALLVEINRQRRSRLQALSAEVGHQSLHGLAEAASAPLISALSSPDARAVALAYRLHLAGLAHLSDQSTWWTPLASDRLRSWFPHRNPRDISWTLNMLNQSLNGFAAAAVPEAILPLSGPDSVRLHGLCGRLLSGLLTAEYEFDGQLAGSSGVEFKSLLRPYPA